MRIGTVDGVTLTGASRQRRAQSSLTPYAATPMPVGSAAGPVVLRGSPTTAEDRRQLRDPPMGARRGRSGSLRQTGQDCALPLTGSAAPTRFPTAKPSVPDGASGPSYEDAVWRR